MKRGLIALCQFLFVFTVFLSVPPEPAQACSCAMQPSVQQELQRKTAVFSGKVVKLTEPSQGLIRSSADPVTAAFAVAEVWKGEVKSRTAVYTAISSASCGYSFQLNTDYLVYASSDGNGKLTTILCDRTKPISEASQDLTALGAGEKPAPLAPLEEAESGKPPDFLYLAFTFAVSFLVCLTGARLGAKHSVPNSKVKLAVGLISLAAACVITLIVYVLL